MRKAFLLGAGLGTRLRPLTAVAPKPLVSVFHRPLATHALDHLASAGIEEVAINTHHLAEEWEKAFPNHEHGGLKLSFFHEEVLLETGGGIKNISSFIDREPILVYNGDILTNIRIDKLITGHLASNNTATLAVRTEGPAPHLAVEGHQVLDIRRKLNIADGTHQFTGIYCIDPEILDLIPAEEKVSVIPAFLELAKKKLLGAYQADAGHWLDLGTREAYLETHGIGAPLIAQAHSPMIHPSAQIHGSASVTNSWIGPDSTIAAGARISDSILWPNSMIAAETRLDGCIVHTHKHIHGNHSHVDL